MDGEALVVRDLRKHYGSNHAVDGVSFSVREGECFGILGPNGAGKTTTIECIEGLRTQDDGDITILGIHNGSTTAQVRQRIGVQLQTTGLYPKLTTREILGTFSGFYDHSLSVDEMIDLVSLREAEKTLSSKLSGGQKQRLSLALALLNEPELVFLDEPTTGLDPQSRRALWDIIRGLKQQGRTVLLTTHYMEEANELCERVAIMDHGRIIELDAPEKLIRKHFTETPIEIGSSERLPAERLQALPAVTSVTAVNGDTTLFSSDVPRTVAALFEIANAEGISLAELTIRQPTLEDVFLKITGRRIRA
ncbi:MAG: ABC transporter ATP-binding protein [Anaerolineae bacterium]